MGRVLNAREAAAEGRPYIIGLTGTFGSGKSTVARLLEEQGAEQLDADAMAREAVEPGSPALERIRRECGEDCITAEGRLDRRRMAERVFASVVDRKRLESIIHPEVGKAMQEGVRAATRRFRETGAPALVVLNVPLLFEAGMEGLADCTAVVAIGESERFRRVRARDGLSEREIVARLGAQWSQSDKMRLADHVVDNTGSVEATRERVAELSRKWLGIPEKGFEY